MSNTSQIGEGPSVKILKKISKQLETVAKLLGRLPVPTTTTTTTLP